MLFNCTTKPAMICQFSNLHTEVSHPCCHLLFAIFLYNSTLFELFFDCKVGCFTAVFQCRYHDGLYLHCPEGSTYKSDVKLIEMPASTLFLETVENKIDSSFEIRS